MFGFQGLQALCQGLSVDNDFLLKEFKIKNQLLVKYTDEKFYLGDSHIVGGRVLSREVEKNWPLLGSACPTELCS